MSTETELRLSLLLAAKGDPRTLRSILAEHGSAVAAFASSALRTRLRVGASEGSHAALVASVKARTAALGARWVSPADEDFPAALRGSDGAGSRDLAVATRAETMSGVDDDTRRITGSASGSVTGSATGSVTGSATGAGSPSGGGIGSSKAASGGADCQLLCIAGELTDADCIGVVGSREADEYGLRIARGIALSAAKVGLVVVSGGARGADSAAHAGALDAGGRTIVVLGTGLGTAMASRQAGLFARCVRQGAIVSEYLPDAAGGKWMFPERNRLVARLSAAVVVAQAALRSGSLITARLAHELGRPVFAPPGDVGYALNEGTNQLIYDGRARPLIHPRDLESLLGARGLGAVGWPRGYARGTMTIPEPPAAGAGPVTSVHELVLSFLQGRGPVSLQTVETRFGPQAGRALLELELEGLVGRAGGGDFVSL